MIAGRALRVARTSKDSIPEGGCVFRPEQLDSDRAMVLVIDLQEKILALVRENRSVVSRSRVMLEGARVFGLPVVLTEQYPKGLGSTESSITEACHAARAERFEKPTFSAWAEASIRERLIQLDRPQVIMVGIETHVCVQQTTLDLRSRDYDVFVCADAVGARGRANHEAALDRMRQAGAFVTTVESVLFELCGTTEAAPFKAMLEVIKANPPKD